MQGRSVPCSVLLLRRGRDLSPIVLVPEPLFTVLGTQPGHTEELPKSPARDELPTKENEGHLQTKASCNSHRFHLTGAPSAQAR